MTDKILKNIVILTGAGISAESGIPVFRSESGLWEHERIEDVCVPEALQRNPQKVHDFYNKMRRSLVDKKPDDAHLAVAKLQREWPHVSGGNVTLVTQNIDDLHEKAGSVEVIHMHGALLSARCESCGASWYQNKDTSPGQPCPKCGRTGGVRPDIVFFEEMPHDMDLIERALAKCDLFLAVGTSGVVYPAAGFCRFAKNVGANCLEFNLDKSAVASDFDSGFYGKASKTLPKFVDALLSGNKVTSLF